MPTTEQLAFRARLHEEWREMIGKQDTKRLIPEACRRVRAAAGELERLGVNPWRALKALKRTVIERQPIQAGLTGCAEADWGRDLFVITTHEDLFDLKVLRLTRWHEVAHVVCLATGWGASHGPIWKAVVRLLGAPEEAAIDFSDVAR